MPPTACSAGAGIRQPEAMSVGIYYYPEQWPREQWKRDLDNIAKLGFDFTHYAEFAWTFLPKDRAPHPGERFYCPQQAETLEDIAATKGESFYRDRCKAHLKPVCEAIRLMHQARIHLEITTLLIPGFNDDLEELNHPWVSYAARSGAPNPVLEKLRVIDPASDE